MNRKFKTLSASLLLAGTLGLANQAHALNIDSFDTTTQFLASPVAVAGSQLAAPEAIGGFRKLDIQSTTGFTTIAANTGPNFGALTVSNNTNVISTTSVLWNHNNGTNGGLNGVDLTDGGASTALLLGISSIDVGLVSIKFDIKDTGSDIASLTLSGLNVGLQTFLFSSFSNYAAVDFTQIQRIQMTIIAGISSDLALDLVETNRELPEPSSLVLMGLGLAGLSCFRKRKNA
ncbi:MAG: PEP-CTERM sorting domain-containing protein [Methylovulum miyakonense]|uniref:PEP-CTERM sorting domain-containing protein n=1 Tax=Methylovulum miyakonense TaxID=645578 RepID=UPI003BB785AE